MDTKANIERDTQTDSCCEPDIHGEVQRYYGEVLESSDDLKTSACCTVVQPDDYVKQALSELHDEVMARYYGCGLALPEALDGLHILDLGCGAGRDVYLLSRLVGEQGGVVGVDMTPEQLEVAREYQEFHREQFAYSQSNVEFIEGNIEALGELALESGSFDAIISNCVINLALDKAAVLASAYRLLRTGGELYFADVYADRRIPSELTKDPVLYGECLSGALYWQDFIALARDAGFAEPLLVESHKIEVEDPELAQKVTGIGFCSATYRLFKADNMESRPENYGQRAIYRGAIAEHPESIDFAAGLSFPLGTEVGISGNLGKILSQSRFSAYFDIIGDDS
ncbi:MAG: methyltransferase domain-containing protein, partial [Gammaproteobacteria bacterium]|nr:methyltransferase domain-containing protein [Gammaproteobacteria bacterium]